MKACKLLILSLTLMITLSGCKASEQDIYQRINKKYTNLESYYAKCEATVWGNKTENKYEFEVFCKMPDMIKIDYLTNDVDIFITGGKAVLKNSAINHDIELSGENADCLNFLINTFFQNYYVGETGSVDVSSSPVTNHTVLECELASGNDYACRQRIYIDNKTALPKRLQTLNAKDEVVIEVNFLEFVFNDSRIDTAFN